MFPLRREREAHLSDKERPMIDAKFLNVAILEHTIASWIDRMPLHLPAPSPELLHPLGRWAKVFAIWIARDRPCAAAIDVAATEYIGQHYGLMLPIRAELSHETDETCFNLATDAGLKIFHKAQPLQAIQAVLREFAASPDRYRRKANSAPDVEWQDYWEKYAAFLV
jgi:hypothetical protein